MSGPTKNDIEPSRLQIQANEAQFYVSMSRGREAMHLFADSKVALREAVTRPSSGLLSERTSEAAKHEAGTGTMSIRSAGLFKWISANQPDDKHEFAHGWWRSMEFVQLLTHDFDDFEFDVIGSFLMETPPPTSTIPMPIVSGRSSNVEIIFKESWVLEPNYTVSVKSGFPGAITLLNMLEPIDPENKWLLRDFPGNYLYEPYREGAFNFSGSVKNQHLLYIMFHILSFEARHREH